jgi:hypothetical protein
MTAAGLASLFIITDLVDPGSGCPCKGGESAKGGIEIDRRIDAALEWLGDNFEAAANPHAGRRGVIADAYYWLYSAERVGMAAGYKYFGRHNWYVEGAEYLLQSQEADGSWKRPPDPEPQGKGLPPVPQARAFGPETCFALLFLHKGRAPVLFNKVRFNGTWNAHRRDIANLTRFIEWAKEQAFQWQIVDLEAPAEELHEAPILYITAESIPAWTAREKAKLREFTDTGGTILLEASCGHAGVRAWFEGLAKELWPEWPLKKLPDDHPVFADPHPLAKARPDLEGIHDGLRTFLFYSPDDISCAWHTRAHAARDYCFRWGINLFTYATDKAPLRARLAEKAPEEEAVRFSPGMKAGPRKTLRIARVKHAGNWEAGANYRPFRALGERVGGKLGVTLNVSDAAAPPYNLSGVPAGKLASFDVAYLAGSKPFALTPLEREALKGFLARGG